MGASTDAWLLCDGVPVALEIAASPRARTRGLLGRDGITGALLLRPARSVHTFRMRFAIDVAYLAADLDVLAIETLIPNRFGRRARGTRQILEAEAGSFERWGLRVGSQLSLPVGGVGDMTRPAALVLVGTPIGNLGDLSPRAVEELASVSVICCEDTRRTGRLLQHAGIERPKLLMVNDHNESSRRAEVVRRLDAGERVAVVTDAGMPGISDPGERLVSAVVRAGHTVEVVPGPSAGIAALVASGLPTGRYVFEGFLPRKANARTERLRSLVDEVRTIVLYEAPHRLARTLADLAEIFGPHRRVAVARELTKMYEEVWRGTMAEAAAWAAARPPRGEIAIVIDGAPEAPAPTDDVVVAELQRMLDDGASTRDAAADVAARLGLAKKRVYSLALGIGR